MNKESAKEKGIAMISSCVNLEQIESCFKYLEQFDNIYHDDSDYTELYKLITDKQKTL